MSLYRDPRPPPRSRQIHADRPRSPDWDDWPVEESVLARAHPACHGIGIPQAAILSVSGFDPWIGEGPAHHRLPPLRFLHTPIIIRNRSPSDDKRTELD
jgi:hypothetical protein